MSTLIAHSRVTPDAKPAQAAVSARLDVPPLEQGDRLTRDEFERRYHAMPDVKRAELIEGVVYMPSPVRLNAHGRPHGRLVTWCGLYESATPGLIAGDNSTARLDLDNEPQPDLLLMIDPARGGQAKISADDYVDGAPEFVAEVAASTVSIDVHTKLNVYRRAGVREYLVWRVRDAAIDWFERAGSDFVRKSPADDGTLRSTVFPGLWLDAPALLAGDLARVIATLNAGIASPEHAAFAAELDARGRPSPPPPAPVITGG